MMRVLWTYKASQRLLLRSSQHFHSRRHASTTVHDPLRILFCGSEDFSIASLRALHREQSEQPDRIASIDVVCRPGKRVGRGLKAVREVPIQGVARELALPIHTIDTFTGWQPPQPQNEPINLIIAVSFGLLVPPRILKGRRYGGLNVHPSLLPDLRGPAPLHHTLLAGCKRSGVTLQTLHPQRFDHGTILAQTPYPGFEIPDPDNCTVPQLLDIVAPKGADLLVQGLRHGLFVPPLKDVGWFRGSENTAHLRHAPKITSEDRHINWDSWTAEEILRRNRVIGPLWNTAACGDGLEREKRVIWSSGFRPSEAVLQQPLRPGTPFAESQAQGSYLLVGTCDGKTLRINDAKVEGEKASPAWIAASRAGLMPRVTDDPSCTFWNTLK